MAENEVNLKAGTKVFIGNAQITLAFGGPAVFEGLTSRDQVAEALAGNSQVAYAEHRDQLAHEEVRPHVFAAGEAARPARFKVSYGLHGARQEELLGEVEAQPEQQPAGEGNPTVTGGSDSDAVN
jgi:hypothetical protein